MDREKVMQALDDSLKNQHCGFVDGVGDVYAVSEEAIKNIIALLKEQGTVEPKTGHWIYKKYDDMFMCSCCEKYSIRNDYPYCHWCGAKMEGRERDA